MYTVTLIKDMPPYKEGSKFGPIDLKGYRNLLDLGYIEDEKNLIKKQKTKKKGNRK